MQSMLEGHGNMVSASFEGRIWLEGRTFDVEFADHSFRQEAPFENFFS